MKLIFAITASALVAALATAQDGGIRIGHRCTIVKGALVADSAQDFARALVMYRVRLTNYTVDAPSGSAEFSIP
jgi:hypothetical protein